MNNEIKKYFQIVCCLNFLIILTSSSCARPTLLIAASTKLREIQVACEYNSTPKKVNMPCEATGIYSDGSAKVITDEAQWSISDPSVLEEPFPDNPNWVRGLASGSTHIEASVGSITGGFLINITSAIPVSVVVTPHSEVFHVGLEKSFSSVCIFSDNSYFDVTRSANWTSYDPAVAIASATNGAAIVSAVNIGQTHIEAEFDGVIGTVPITILEKMLTGISIDISSVTVAQGLTNHLTATGVYADLTTVDLTSLVTWSILDGNIAHISNNPGQKGYLTAILLGSTKAQINFAGFSDQADITVSNPNLTSITIAPLSPSLALGLSHQLVATGYYSDGSHADISESATWTTSDVLVTSVSNVALQKGNITAIGLGSATVTAAFAGQTGTITAASTPSILQSIQLTPNSLAIALGRTSAMVATGTYSDGTTLNLTNTATWTSSQPLIASVSNGLVTSLTLGPATITATVGAVSRQASLNINPAVLDSIAVTPPSGSIAKGTNLQYVATGTYSDGSTANITSLVAWGSSNLAVATISNVFATAGRAFGAGAGSANITATLGLVSGQMPITVTPATLLSIVVTPANSTIIILIQTVQMVATGHYSDGSTANITSQVTWTSTNPLTVTVSNIGGCEGEASGLGLGSTTIRATAPGGVFGTTQLNGIL